MLVVSFGHISKESVVKAYQLAVILCAGYRVIGHRGRELILRHVNTGGICFLEMNPAALNSFSYDSALAA